MICFQQCMKASVRKPIFFYSQNDDEKLDFTSQDRPKDQTKVDECSRNECAYKACKESHYLITMHRVFNGPYSSYQFKPSGFLNIEKPFLNLFEFYLNVFGFVSFLFGISLNLTFSNLSLLVNIKFNWNLKIAKLTFILSNFLLLLLSVLVLEQTVAMITQHVQEPSSKIYKTFDIFEYHEFDLYLCYPLPIVLQNYSNVEHTNLTELRGSTKQLLEQRTLTDLAFGSSRPDQLINRIYYNYKSTENQIDIRRPITYAYLNAKYTNLEIYSRCFTYRVPRLDEPYYRTQLQASRLVIESKVSTFSMFITAKSSKLTMNTTQLRVHHNVEIDIDHMDERTESCLNYHERVELKCTTKENCINDCILETFRNRFNRTPPHVVINENTYPLVKHSRFSLVNAAELADLKEECKRKFPEPDCHSVAYSNDQFGVPTIDRDGKIKLFIYFSTRITETKKSNDSLGVGVNISTLYSILIGLSFPLILNLFYKLFNRNSLFKSMKRTAFGYLSVLRILITLAFFIYYLRIVVSDSIYNQVYSFYIENQLDNLSFPVVGLCVKYMPNKTVPNDLTGHQLNELTSQLTVKSVIEKIKYINQTNEENEWRPGEQLNASDLEIDYSYYMELKCIELDYKLNVKKIELNKFNEGLKIRLRPELASTYYYYTKANKNSTFSRFHKLDHNQSYLIYFERVAISSKDIFQSFKNPLHWIITGHKVLDPTYLKFLKSEFEKQKNYTTVWLPLHNESFDLKIRNDLFEQFVDEISWSERYVVDRNFDLTFYREHMSVLPPREYGLKFSKRIFPICHKIVSYYNYVTFFTNVLNLISFWCGLNILEFLTQSVQYACSGVHSGVKALFKFVNKVH